MAGLNRFVPFGVLPFCQKTEFAARLFLWILWKKIPCNPAETIAFSGGLCYDEENYTGGMFCFSVQHSVFPEVPNENRNF